MKHSRILNHSCKQIGHCVTMFLIKSFLSGLLLLGVLCLTQYCVAQNSAISSNDDELRMSFEALFEQYALEEEDAYLELLWDEYLKNRTQFNNDEYQKACRHLGTQYHQSVIELGQCCNKASEQEKSYSSQWLDDLIEQFGKDYVLEKFDLIMLHFSYLYSRNAQSSCEDFEKEALYREYPYKAAYNEYISLYLDFVESLDEEQKIKLNKRKEALEGLRELLSKASIKDLFSVGSVHAPLFAVAVKERPDSDIKLTEFFLQHPFFSKPFNGANCASDLEKLDSQ